MVSTGAGGQAKVDLSNIAEDLIPEVHNTYNIGSSTKNWAAIYAVIAILTSIVIGGVVSISTIDSVLFINASTMINGSLNVLGDNITVGGVEVATLTDLVAGNVTITSVVNIKNIAGATAYKGMAMSFVSYNAGADRFNAEFADNTAPANPSECLMTSTVINNGIGQCVGLGALE